MVTDSLNIVSGRELEGNVWAPLATKRKMEAQERGRKFPKATLSGFVMEPGLGS